MNTKAIIKKEDGYTLIELLFTILIVSIILVVVTSMLIQILRIGQKADLRRAIRQDIELSLDIMRRDFRNANSRSTLVACNPTGTSVQPKTVYKLVDATAPDTLDIVLSNSLEKITYSVTTDPSTQLRSLLRTYENNGTITQVYLTSEDVDLTKFQITCSNLLQENKFLLIEVHGDSPLKGNNGKIVEDIARYTGVTIRNTAN
jgi:prepilin-type N-terminal cleavage/methylation domain-containing protein